MELKRIEGPHYNMNILTVQYVQDITLISCFGGCYMSVTIPTVASHGLCFGSCSGHRSEHAGLERSDLIVARGCAQNPQQPTDLHRTACHQVATASNLNSILHLCKGDENTAFHID